MGGDLLCWSDFLKSGQIITGSTSLLYRGNDGTGRILNPDIYQPKGSYATTAELNELKISVSSGKAQVASAITDKGVSTSSTASFSQMATNIRNITSGPDVSSKLIAGNILYGDGGTHWGISYPNTKPPLYQRDYAITMGYAILNSRNGLKISCSSSTYPWYYLFYDTVTALVYIAQANDGLATASIPSSCKNGHPFIITLYCGNGVSASNIYQVQFT